MRRSATALSVATLLIAIAGPASSAPERPPVRLPSNPTGLPAPGPVGDEVDDPAGYVGQVACVAHASRGIAALRALVLETYGRGGDSPAAPRACTSGGQSEHKDGRAWDWMVPVASKPDRLAAADLLSWLTKDGDDGTPAEMASRLGIMYLIYNRKIWSSYDPEWHTYNGADPHTSHVHISLSWNGAYRRTSFWTGKTWPTVTGPCQVFAGQPAVIPTPSTRPCADPQPAVRDSSKPLVWLGSSGSDVSLAQGRLDLDQTGSFDVATRRAVLAYQRAEDLPPTGAIDGTTWSRLLPSSSALEVPKWTPAEAAAWARRSGEPTLRQHMGGKAVYALQAALRMAPIDRSGYYGTKTRDIVVAVKTQLGLDATPVVTADLWRLLPAP